MVFWVSFSMFKTSVAGFGGTLARPALLVGAEEFLAWADDCGVESLVGGGTGAPSKSTTSG